MYVQYTIDMVKLYKYIDSTVDIFYIFLLKDESLLSFLRGGLKIRSCYHTYKYVLGVILQIFIHRCFRFMISVPYWFFLRSGVPYSFIKYIIYFKHARVCFDMMEDLHKSGRVSSRFSDFKGGVNLGLGTFNLVSICKQKVYLPINLVSLQFNFLCYVFF